MNSTLQDKITFTKKTTINVQGREMTLGEILGDLHMIRGKELENLKNAVRTKYEILKEIEIFRMIIQKIESKKCDSDDNFDLRMKYKDIFYRGGEEDDPVGKEFGYNQKAIDRAFDLVNQRNK